MSQPESERGYYDFLEALAKFVKPYFYLELGCAEGRAFNRVAPYAELAYAVDVDAKRFEAIRHNENLVWYPGDTLDFINSLKDEEFDLVFSDAHQVYERAAEDFWAIFPFVRDGGLIVFDDSHPPNYEKMMPHKCGEVYKLAEDLRDSMLCEIVTIPIDCGFSIVRKAKKQVSWL